MYMWESAPYLVAHLKKFKEASCEITEGKRPTGWQLGLELWLSTDSLEIGSQWVTAWLQHVADTWASEGAISWGGDTEAHIEKNEALRRNRYSLQRGTRKQ